MKFYHLFILVFLSGKVEAQKNDADLAPLLIRPRQYAIIKTSEVINIDGKGSEQAWSKAQWSDAFVEIQGKRDSIDPYSTRYKMLWDKDFLYVYTEFREEHIWAKLKDHDQSIFHNNCLEIFIDPDGDSHNYIEFQINAFEAVWDLFMTKPYRNGGMPLSAWDIKGLKKAVNINGTLNDPSDKDKSWGIELAFPLNSLVGRNLPLVGSVWRMNFSRVQYQMDIKDGVYERKQDAKGRLLPSAYYVWSPQGLVNLHYPERYGFVKFADESGTEKGFIHTETEALTRMLWKYYYLQQDFKIRYGKYATTLADLKKDFPNVTFQNTPRLQLIGTDFQYQIQIKSSSLKTIFIIDHEGKQVQFFFPK
ncbi:MAG TPA: carbohydrate-binding family 9-like protein [Sphingobacteriaceae bacterium]|nr:carbohydrate-binding family 9-like protein [Sphingobacteriaceae bacterium]